MPTEIKINGTAEIVGKLKRMARLTNAVSEIVRREGISMREELKRYPPELPNQQYVRTGKLGQSWKSEYKVTTGKASTTVYSDPQIASNRGRYYAGWVQSTEKAGGSGPQARIHQGRWKTAQALLNERLPNIEESMKREIEKQLNK